MTPERPCTSTFGSVTEEEEEEEEEGGEEDEGNKKRKVAADRAPAEPENQNTLRKTLVDVRLLNTYLTSLGVTGPVHQMKLEALDSVLADFIVSVRKKNGDEFEPSSLRGILGSVDRWLRRHEYGHSVFQSAGDQFRRTKDALKAKQKRLKEEGKGNRPNRTEAPTEEELRKLYECGAVGLHDPAALIHMLFFNISIYFSLSPKEQYDLKWGDVKLRVDSSGLEYLEFWDRQPKTATLAAAGDSFHDVCSFRLRMYTNANPERDPIKAYKMYADQRPPDMQNLDSPFYIAPNYMYNPSYSLWYRNMRIGKNTLRAMAKLVKQMDGLPNDHHFTNPSPSETSTQERVDIFIPPIDVPQISGNKNLQNMNNFCGLSEREQTPHILSGAVQNFRPNAASKPSLRCHHSVSQAIGRSRVISLQDAPRSGGLCKGIKEEPENSDFPNQYQAENIPRVSHSHKAAVGISSRNTSDIMSSTIQSILELHKLHGDIHVHIHDDPPQKQFKCIIIRSECDEE